MYAPYEFPVIGSMWKEKTYARHMHLLIYILFLFNRVKDANGVETVTIEENGVEVSRKVNGEEQIERIEYTSNRPPQQQASRHSRSRGDNSRHELKSESHGYAKRRRN